MEYSERRWQWGEQRTLGRRGGMPIVHWLRAKECAVELYPRPTYCDRGSWQAFVLCPGHPRNPNPFDSADGFPRYYFDLDRAKAEIEAMFDKRGYTPLEEPDNG